MQNEITANAIAWGFSTFSKTKCLVKPFSSLQNRCDSSARGGVSGGSVREGAGAQCGNYIHECSLDDTLIVSQGISFEIGLEFSPLPSFADSIDDFINSFEKQKDLLKFTLEIQELDGRNISRRETAHVQKSIKGVDNNIIMDCTKFERKLESFYIGTVTSVQLPPEYLNTPIRFVLSAFLSIPDSLYPSNHRPHMSSEELALRAMLEGGRYRVPKVEPIEVSLPAIILDPLQIECWSKSINPWCALLGVEISNAHPYQAVSIQNVEINMPATLSVYENNVHNPVQHQTNEEGHNRYTYTPCYPPVHNWLDTIPVPATHRRSTPNDNFSASSSSSTLVASGEAVTKVFKVSQKDACHRNIPLSESNHHFQCEKFAQFLYGDVPPSSLSGNFVSPVDIRWCEVSQSPSHGTEVNNTISLMQSTVPIYWELDKREGTEFIVDIRGPNEGDRFKPISLELLITNHTMATRDIVIFLQDPSLASSKLDSGNGNFLNHEISVPVGGVHSGEKASVSVVIFPLQIGQMEFSSIYIVDAISGEIFTTSSAFSILINQ